MDTKRRSFFFMKMCLKFTRNYGFFLKYTFFFKTTNDKFYYNTLDIKQLMVCSLITEICIHVILLKTRYLYIQNFKEYRQQIWLMFSIYHLDKQFVYQIEYYLKSTFFFNLIFYLVHANINLIGAEKKPAEKMTHYIFT